MNSTPRTAYSKPPRNFDEQIKLLKDRGLKIPDEALAKSHLQHINYYRLSVYFLPFTAPDDKNQFSPNATFDQILNFYEFDRALRLLVLDAIERIEVSLRTQFAYHLSDQYDTAHPQLVPELFSFKSTEIYNQEINKINQALKRNEEVEAFIKHFIEKYSDTHPPIWAVVELLSMGQLSRWFSNIKRAACRKAISAIYNLDETIMISTFAHLSLVRNHAAHHDRLWNRSLVKKLKFPRTANRVLKNSFQTLSGNNLVLDSKLYNTLVMLTYLMHNICGNDDWRDQLKKLIKHHSMPTAPMGFPNDWESRGIWKLQPSSY